VWNIRKVWIDTRLVLWSVSVSSGWIRMNPDFFFIRISGFDLDFDPDGKYPVWTGIRMSFHIYLLYSRNISPSSNRRKTINGSLESSHWELSNGTKMSFLASIDDEIIFKIFTWITRHLLMLERLFWYHSKALYERILMIHRSFFYDHWIASYCAKTV